VDEAEGVIPAGNKETALDAVRVGYQKTVLSTGVRAVGVRLGDGDAALEDIRKAGGRVE
jgi:hypothetical protein